MLPSNTNNTSPCTPVSSNCVIWQGPNIPCINLCNGDTVSDVVGKLATELCALIDATCVCNPDLTGLDISCITQSTPDGLVATLQAIIDYVCAQSPTVVLSNFALPECLYYNDPLGNLVTSLNRNDWAVYIGNQLCSVINSITSINQNILNLYSRIEILEACVLPCTPNTPSDFFLISNCIFPGREVTISSLVLAIESQLCSLLSATGTVAMINTAIASQPVSSSDTRLAVNGTLGNINGWINSPSNLAESNVNQWLLLGDLYAAVSDIQAALPANCDNTNFVFTYNTLDNSGDGVPDTINLNFQACVIPAGFTDCGGITTVTVVDSNGSSISQNINVTGLVSATSGVNIDISSLNRLSSLNLTIPFCITDGNSQCADRQHVIIPLNVPCPSSVTVSGSSTAVNVSFSNTLGSSVTYEIEATSQTTGAVLGTTTITNPTTSINYSFTGVTPGDTYNVQITVIAGPTSRNSCPIQTATIPGSICSDVEVITPSTATVNTNDVFLGLYDNGVSINRYWYDYTNGLIKTENVGANIPCDSPILSSPTMDYLGTPGDVAVTVSYGTEPSPISAEISYSVDGIAYLGLATGSNGVRTIATGTTSGSVYIKVQTTCTGPIQSVPTIIRYDFETEVWTTIQSPQECADTSLTTACAAGVEVTRQYLDCGSSTYTVFGGSAESYWFYVTKRVDGSTTRYIYAGWDNVTNSVRSVVECCACPVFILSDPIQILCGHDGDSVNITLPYVLGAGEPNMTIITSPVLGTVVQGAIANEFTYTAINPSGSADYADTFQVQLQPTVPGTGNCSLDTFTVQVQMISCEVKLNYTNQDLYIFVNTTGITSAEGAQLQNGFTQLDTYWNTQFGFTGNIYFIPTDSKRWLGYFKSIADDGASWLQSSNLAWQALENLPTSWPGGTGTGVYKNAATVMIFSNNSSGDYHDSTLAAGYGSGVTAQPTTPYKEDYDSLIDILTGTQTSTWAQTLGITQNQFPDGLSCILYPMTVNGSGSADAANILQMISAYTAQLIPPSKYGIKTAPNVTSYILQGIAASMPYTGATTPTNTITQLFEKTNFGTLAFLDQEYSSTVFNNEIDNGDGDFRERLTRSLKGCANTYPASTLPALNVYEVEDCSTSDVYFVRITGQSCGTISNGTVIKLNNPGATFSPGGGRADWTTLTNRCVTILDNCSSTAQELITTLVSRHINCASCTP
jgi:hypothetical protein